ncbi:unnamed protein product [Amoebophrya sp. A25]|nr:unnamed protein product [Amoebophrya sp. A25]|eukprot:GSA25T00022375001.1
MMKTHELLLPKKPEAAALERLGIDAVADKLRSTTSVGDNSAGAEFSLLLEEKVEHLEGDAMRRLRIQGAETNAAVLAVIQELWSNVFEEFVATVRMILPSDIAVDCERLEEAGAGISATVDTYTSSPRISGAVPVEERLVTLDGDLDSCCSAIAHILDVKRNYYQERLNEQQRLKVMSRSSCPSNNQNAESKEAELADAHGQQLSGGASTSSRRLWGPVGPSPTSKCDLSVSVPSNIGNVTHIPNDDAMNNFDHTTKSSNAGPTPRAGPNTTMRSDFRQQAPQRRSGGGSSVSSTPCHATAGGVTRSLDDTDYFWRFFTPPDMVAMCFKGTTKPMYHKGEPITKLCMMLPKSLAQVNSRKIKEIKEKSGLRVLSLNNSNNINLLSQDLFAIFLQGIVTDIVSAIELIYAPASAFAQGSKIVAYSLFPEKVLQSIVNASGCGVRDELSKNYGVAGILCRRSEMQKLSGSQRLLAWTGPKTKIAQSLGKCLNKVNADSTRVQEVADHGEQVAVAHTPSNAELLEAGSTPLGGTSVSNRAAAGVFGERSNTATTRSLLNGCDHASLAGAIGGSSVNPKSTFPPSTTSTPCSYNLLNSNASTGGGAPPFGGAAQGGHSQNNNGSGMHQLPLPPQVGTGGQLAGSMNLNRSYGILNINQEKLPHIRTSSRNKHTAGTAPFVARNNSHLYGLLNKQSTTPVMANSGQQQQQPFFRSTTGLVSQSQAAQLPVLQPGGQQAGQQSAIVPSSQQLGGQSIAAGAMPSQQQQFGGSQLAEQTTSGQTPSMHGTTSEQGLLGASLVTAPRMHGTTAAELQGTTTPVICSTTAPGTAAPLSSLEQALFNAASSNAAFSRCGSSFANVNMGTRTTQQEEALQFGGGQHQHQNVQQLGLNQLGLGQGQQPGTTPCSSTAMIGSATAMLGLCSSTSTAASSKESPINVGTRNLCPATKADDDSCLHTGKHESKRKLPHSLEQVHTTSTCLEEGNGNGHTTLEPSGASDFCSTSIKASTSTTTSSTRVEFLDQDVKKHAHVLRPHDNKKNDDGVIPMLDTTTTSEGDILGLTAVANERQGQLTIHDILDSAPTSSEEAGGDSTSWLEAGAAEWADTYTVEELSAYVAELLDISESENALEAKAENDTEKAENDTEKAEAKDEEKADHDGKESAEEQIKPVEVEGEKNTAEKKATEGKGILLENQDREGAEKVEQATIAADPPSSAPSSTSPAPDDAGASVVDKVEGLSCAKEAAEDAQAKGIIAVVGNEDEDAKAAVEEARVSGTEDIKRDEKEDENDCAPDTGAVVDVHRNVETNVHEVDEPAVPVVDKISDISSEEKTAVPVVEKTSEKVLVDPATTAPQAAVKNTEMTIITLQDGQEDAATVLEEENNISNVVGASASSTDEDEMEVEDHIASGREKQETTSCLEPLSADSSDSFNAEQEEQQKDVGMEEAITTMVEAGGPEGARKTTEEQNEQENVEKMPAGQDDERQANVEKMPPASLIIAEDQKRDEMPPANDEEQMEQNLEAKISERKLTLDCLVPSNEEVALEQEDSGSGQEKQESPPPDVAQTTSSAESSGQDDVETTKQATQQEGETSNPETGAPSPRQDASMGVTNKEVIHTSSTASCSAAAAEVSATSSTGRVDPKTAYMSATTSASIMISLESREAFSEGISRLDLDPNAGVDIRLDPHIWSVAGVKLARVEININHVNNGVDCISQIQLLAANLEDRGTTSTTSSKRLAAWALEDVRLGEAFAREYQFVMSTQVMQLVAEKVEPSTFSQDDTNKRTEQKLSESTSRSTKNIQCVVFVPPARFSELLLQQAARRLYSQNHVEAEETSQIVLGPLLPKACPPYSLMSPTPTGTTVVGCSTSHFAGSSSPTTSKGAGASPSSSGGGLSAAAVAKASSTTTTAVEVMNAAHPKSSPALGTSSGSCHIQHAPASQTSTSQQQQLLLLSGQGGQQESGGCGGASGPPQDSTTSCTTTTTSCSSLPQLGGGGAPPAAPTVVFGSVDPYTGAIITTSSSSASGATLSGAALVAANLSGSCGASLQSTTGSGTGGPYQLHHGSKKSATMMKGSYYKGGKNKYAAHYHGKYGSYQHHLHGAAGGKYGREQHHAPSSSGSYSNQQLLALQHQLLPTTIAGSSNSCSVVAGVVGVASTSTGSSSSVKVHGKYGAPGVYQPPHQLSSPGTPPREEHQNGTARCATSTPSSSATTILAGQGQLAGQQGQLHTAVVTSTTGNNMGGQQEGHQAFTGAAGVGTHHSVSGQPLQVGTSAPSPSAQQQTSHNLPPLGTNEPQQHQLMYPNHGTSCQSGGAATPSGSLPQLNVLGGSSGTPSMAQLLQHQQHQSTTIPSGLQNGLAGGGHQACLGGPSAGHQGLLGSSGPHSSNAVQQVCTTATMMMKSRTKKRGRGKKRGSPGSRSGSSSSTSSSSSSSSSSSDSSADARRRKKKKKKLKKSKKLLLKKEAAKKVTSTSTTAINMHANPHPATQNTSQHTSSSQHTASSPALAALNAGKGASSMCDKNGTIKVLPPAKVLPPGGKNNTLAGSMSPPTTTTTATTAATPAATTTTTTATAPTGANNSSASGGTTSAAAAASSQVNVVVETAQQDSRTSSSNDIKLTGTTEGDVEGATPQRKKKRSSKTSSKKLKSASQGEQGPGEQGPGEQLPPVLASSTTVGGSCPSPSDSCSSQEDDVETPPQRP